MCIGQDLGVVFVDLGGYAAQKGKETNLSHLLVVTLNIIDILKSFCVFH